MKNEALKELLYKLTDQRKSLVSELTNMDYNNSNYLEKKSTIEIQINNIDAQMNALLISFDV